MSLLGFKAQNHPQLIPHRGVDDSVDDRQTPDGVFAPLDAIYRFTVDVAASDANARCGRYYTLERDGLRQSWAGERVWCNPPYSKIEPWVEKAWAETAEAIVMLLPANRTEQRWWQEHIEPRRDQPGSPLSVRFLAGRPRFLKAGQRVVGANERPPFGVCLVIWKQGDFGVRDTP